MAISLHHDYRMIPKKRRLVMIQTVLPIFPSGANEINSHIGFQEKDGLIYYFHGQFPVFSHRKDDLNSFRFVTAQFHICGHVKQVEIVNAFGVTPISVKRSVKLLREHGIEGLAFSQSSRKNCVTPIFCSMDSRYL